MKLFSFPDIGVQNSMRIFVITALVLMFATVLFHEVFFGSNPDLKNLLIGSLIGSFSTAAVQYLFGSTPNSANKDATIAQMAQTAHAALYANPPLLPPPAPAPEGAPVAEPQN